LCFHFDERGGAIVSRGAPGWNSIMLVIFMRLVARRVDAITRFEYAHLHATTACFEMKTGIVPGPEKVGGGFFCAMR
jgi:hypothetical protein